MINNVLTNVQKNKLNKLARKIIEKNQYLSLATVNSGGNPWISPVCYTYDRDWNLYFVSVPNSKHSKNSQRNRNVAYSIFDSRQKWGLGVGLQIEGTIKKLNLKDSIAPGRLYIKRNYPYGSPNVKVVFNFIKKYLKTKKVYRFYKLIPRTVWINNPYSPTDGRVEVDLKN